MVVLHTDIKAKTPLSFVLVILGIILFSLLRTRVMFANTYSYEDLEPLNGYFSKL